MGSRNKVQVLDKAGLDLPTMLIVSTDYWGSTFYRLRILHERAVCWTRGLIRDVVCHLTTKKPVQSTWTQGFRCHNDFCGACWQQCIAHPPACEYEKVAADCHDRCASSVSSASGRLVLACKALTTWSTCQAGQDICSHLLLGASYPSHLCIEVRLGHR